MHLLEGLIQQRCVHYRFDMYMVNAVAGGTISLTTGPISGTAFATDTYLTL